eukprot:923179-Heterocapsa_arctica.AAC.1
MPEKDKAPGKGKNASSSMPGQFHAYLANEETPEQAAAFLKAKENAEEVPEELEQGPPSGAPSHPG